RQARHGPVEERSPARRYAESVTHLVDHVEVRGWHLRHERRDLEGRTDLIDRAVQNLPRRHGLLTGWKLLDRAGILFARDRAPFVPSADGAGSFDARAEAEAHAAGEGRRRRLRQHGVDEARSGAVADESRTNVCR